MSLWKLLTAKHGAGAGDYDQVRMDAATNVLATIEYEHHEIHDGSSFVVREVQSVDTTTFKWLITTPATTKYAHMIFNVSCTGEMLVVVTEGADRVDGDLITPVNRYRVGSPAAATVVVSRAPTEGATDGAIVLTTQRVGATGVASKTIESGEARGIAEYVLKPATKYIVAITTYAAVYVSIGLDWYEHTRLH